MTENSDFTEVDALASAWEKNASEAGLPVGYDGVPSPEAHAAVQKIEASIRDHIVGTGDVRLFGLLHLLGQASLQMERILWPEQFQYIADKVQEAVKAADKPRSRNYSPEEVRQHVRESIERHKSGCAEKE